MAHARLLLALLFLALPAQGALRIHMKSDISSGKNSMKMNTVLTMQGGKLRIDSDVGKTSVYILNNEMITAIHPSRTYIKMKTKRNAPQAAKSRDLTVKKLHSNVRVGGLVCDDYEIHDKKTKVMDMCVADLGRNNLMKDVLAESGSAVLAQYLKERPMGNMPPGFPARMIAYHQGKALSHTEIVKIERPLLLPASTFSPPAGYKKLDLGAFGG